MVDECESANPTKRLRSTEETEKGGSRSSLRAGTVRPIRVIRVSWCVLPAPQFTGFHDRWRYRREDLRSCFLGLTITSLSVATAIKIVADMSVSNLNLRFTVLVHRTGHIYINNISCPRG
jgi:hypothetical protein